MTLKLSHLLAFGCAVLMSSGCATKIKTVQLDNPAELRAATGSLVTVTEPPSDFIHSQSSKAMLGVIGSIMNIDAGMEIERNGVVSDPSLTVEAKLSEYLSANTSLTAGDSLSYKSRKDVPDAPTIQDGYTVDAVTEAWGLNYGALNWNSYHAIYKGNVRLIDPKGKTVAATHCSYKYPEALEDQPTYSELISGGGILLQKNLQIVANKCVEKFKADSLSGL
ncbi:MAG: hypothetical protein ABJN22_11595 [Litorimonas sp.]